MITSVARLRGVAGALFALVLILSGAPWSMGRAVSAQNQVLYLSILDANGEAVTDLGPDDV
ncbi:MAG: hypothetical protein E2P06_06310, partial [Acidobacteria bacterium]